MRSLPPPITFDADDQVTQSNRRLLSSNFTRVTGALAYLAARGLNHPELITRFKLGYANRTLGLRLPVKQNLTGEAIRSRLQKNRHLSRKRSRAFQWQSDCSCY